MNDHAPPSAPGPTHQGPDITMIKVPMLVSGILNALGAASLIITGVLMLVVLVGCFILPFGIAAGVLAFFEIKMFTDLNKPGDHRDKRGRIQLIAILEICTIIYGNVPSMVCGILALVSLPKLDEQAP